jgi:hypothetical protein
MVRKVLLTFCCFMSFVCASGKPVAATPAAATTQVQSSQCGQVLAALNSNITANLVSGATQYRFKVTTILPDSSVLEQYVTSNSRVFNLTQMDAYAYGRTYSIQVAVNLGGVWQSYGSTCAVVTPTPVTRIQSNQCGIMMASVSDPVYAYLVSYATGYRFRITSTVNPAQVFIVDRPLREFRMSLFPAQSGIAYNVEVAARNLDGTYLPYGSACTVSAPILYTKIDAAYCGRVMSLFSDFIYAYLVPNCSMYRFKVTNMSTSAVQIVDRPLRVFSLDMLSNVQYNTAYKIEVAIKDMSGTILPYGAFCTVYTPLVSVPKIQLSQCETTCTTNYEMVYSDIVPNATLYRFRLDNYVSGYSHYIERYDRSFNLSMFNGLQPNTTYNIRVAAKVNGVFTIYGKTCVITTPATSANTRLAVSDNMLQADNKINMPLMPQVYPNPFSEYFSVDAALPANAEVSVKVYDMMARLVEQTHVTCGRLLMYEFGENYPPGVYNVVISAGDELKTLRVIKR